MTASEAADPAGEAGRAEDLAALQRYGSALLRRAVGFLMAVLDALPPLTAAELARPTPCAGWDLHMLLRHLDDSLTALNEAVTIGTVPLFPSPEVPQPDLPAALREGAHRLLGAWTDADRQRRVVTVAGCAVRAGTVAGTGAIELAVHGWDISRAAGRRVQMPDQLAGRLLRLAPLLVPGHAREELFGPPVPVPPDVPLADRLVAFLGRAPGPDVRTRDAGTRTV